MEDEEFIEFLISRGIGRDTARTWVDQVYANEIGDDEYGYMHIEGSGGLMTIDVDASMGFAGQLKFRVLEGS